MAGNLDATDSVMALLTLVGGGNTAEFESYALGVPHPKTQGEWAGNYDPLTYTVTDPSEWPSAASAGHYYIDKSHPDATDDQHGLLDNVTEDGGTVWGIPNRPRLTPPDPLVLAAGETVRFGNSSGSDAYSFPGSGGWNITASGTSASPCYIDGNYSGTRVRLDEKIELGAGCTHLFVDGFETFNIGQVLDIDSGSHRYLTVRDWLVFGDNTVNPTPRQMFLMGTSVGPGATSNQFMVYFDNTVRNVGLYGQNSDCIGFVPGLNCSNFWIIGNTSHGIGGDSARIGAHDTAGQYTEEEYAQNFYLAKNTFYDNDENPLDIKSCTDVVISENTFYNGNDGQLVPIHQNCKRIWMIFNKMWDAGSGCVISTDSGAPENIHFIGNEISNIWNTGGTGDAGVAFRIRPTSTNNNIDVINNTCYDYVGGVRELDNPGTLTTTVVGNIFSTRNVADAKYDVEYEGSSQGGSEELDHNVYSNTYIRVNSTDHTALSTLTAATGQEANGVNDAASINFQDAGSRDFRLQAGSDARDVGISAEAEAVYDQFETDWGINIKVDINGNPRPADISTWNAGAHENI